MVRTRQKVIDVARKRLNQGKSIQIAELVESTGVSVGSLYHHFENKVGIWDAIEGEALQTYIQGARARLINDLSRGRDGSIRRGKRGKKIFEDTLLAFHAWFQREQNDRFRILAHGNRKEKIAEHLKDLQPRDVENMDAYIAMLLGPLFFQSGATQQMVGEIAEINFKSRVLQRT